MGCMLPRAIRGIAITSPASFNMTPGLGVLVGGLGAGELAEVVRVTRQELARALAIISAAAVILVPLE